MSLLLKINKLREKKEKREWEEEKTLDGSKPFSLFFLQGLILNLEKEKNEVNEILQQIELLKNWKDANGVLDVDVETGNVYVCEIGKNIHSIFGKLHFNEFKVLRKYGNFYYDKDLIFGLIKKIKTYSSVYRLDVLEDEIVKIKNQLPK